MEVCTGSQPFDDIPVNVTVVFSSEGVQVGGVRSLYGVLGVWTSVEHDINDPVGEYNFQYILLYVVLR